MTPRVAAAVADDLGAGGPAVGRIRSRRMPRFIHLRVHSACSLLEGAIPMKALPGLVAGAGYPAVAVTDTNNLFGALEFSEGAAKAGVQPIIGLQLALTYLDAEPGKKPPEPAPLALYAQDETGYRNLMALSSAAYLETDTTRTPQVGLDRLAAPRRGRDLPDRRPARAARRADRQRPRCAPAGRAAGRHLPRPALCRDPAPRHRRPAAHRPRGRDRAGAGAAGLRARPAAGRHGRGLLRDARHARGARRLPLHRPGCLPEPVGPRPPDTRALAEARGRDGRPLRRHARGRRQRGRDRHALRLPARARTRRSCPASPTTRSTNCAARRARVSPPGWPSSRTRRRSRTTRSASTSSSASSSRWASPVTS